MLFFDTERTFNYSWEQVTRANWSKYPNEITTHVETVDILRREVDPETGVLRTERLIGCHQPVPAWIGAIVGSSPIAYVREVSEVDPRNRTLTMRSRNLSHCKFLSVFETVTYTPDPTNAANETVFKQSATFTSDMSWRKLCNKIEEFSVNRFTHNAQLGQQAFESVLERLSKLADVQNTAHNAASSLQQPGDHKQ